MNAGGRELAPNGLVLLSAKLSMPAGQAVFHLAVGTGILVEDHNLNAPLRKVRRNLGACSRATDDGHRVRGRRRAGRRIHEGRHGGGKIPVAPRDHDSRTLSP